MRISSVFSYACHDSSITVHEYAPLIYLVLRMSHVTRIEPAQISISCWINAYLPSTLTNKHFMLNLSAFSTAGSLTKSSEILHHTASCCNMMYHTATYCKFSHKEWMLRYVGIVSNLQSMSTDPSCNTMQHTATTGYVKSSATHCNRLQNTATHVKIDLMPYTATHCNTLQHTATHCNTTATYCNTQQHTATHCNILQHPATQLQHTATHCNTLQHTATHCNTLQTPQHATTHCNTSQQKL